MGATARKVVTTRLDTDGDINRPSRTRTRSPTPHPNGRAKKVDVKRAASCSPERIEQRAKFTTDPYNPKNIKTEKIQQLSPPDHQGITNPEVSDDQTVSLIQENLHLKYILTLIATNSTPDKEEIKNKGLTELNGLIEEARKSLHKDDRKIDLYKTFIQTNNKISEVKKTLRDMINTLCNSAILIQKSFKHHQTNKQISNITSEETMQELLNIEIQIKKYIDLMEDAIDTGIETMNEIDKKKTEKSTHATQHLASIKEEYQKIEFIRNELKQIFGNTNNEIEKKTRLLQQLINENEKLRDTAKNFISKSIKKEKELEEKNREITELQSSNKLLRKEIAYLATKIQEAEKKINNGKISHKESEITPETSHTRSTEKLTKEIDLLQAELEKTKIKSEHRRVEIKNLSANQRASKTELNIFKKKAEDYLSENQKLQETITNLEKELITKNEHIKKGAELLEKAKERHLTLNSELNDRHEEQTKLQNKVITLKKELSTKERELDDSKNELAKTKEMLDHSIQKIDHLESREKTLLHLSKTLEKGPSEKRKGTPITKQTETHTAELLQHIETLEKDLSEKTKSLEAVQKKLNYSKQKNKNLEQSALAQSDAINELTTKLNVSRKETAHYKMAAESSLLIVDIHKQKNKTMESMEATIEGLEKQVRSLIANQTASLQPSANIVQSEQGVTTPATH